MQFSYTMSYVQGYDFNDGWIIRKDKEFLPYSVSFTYQSPDKTFFKWFNRISVTPGLNTSIVADLLRPTNSYFIFSPSIISFNKGIFIKSVFCGLNTILDI